jgi:hypothetical protein
MKRHQQFGLRAGEAVVNPHTPTRRAGCRDEQRHRSAAHRGRHSDAAGSLVICLYNEDARENTREFIRAIPFFAVVAIVAFSGASWAHDTIDHCGAAHGRCL